ncbi:MAG: N-6 DNA methylase [Pseudanabaena sp.]
MAIKKSELYSSLWQGCDELRGGMDASQYKDYVLVLLFVKYVSDKYAGQQDALLEVPVGGRFADMVALKGDKEIGDKMNKIVAQLAEANDLKGTIDIADFNSEEKLGKGKEMVDRLSNLVSIFNTPALDFRGNRADGDDLLGDAYEYLMRHFATESGKSKGQFYTPAEVSRIMAKVIGIGAATDSNQTIYDPTCGSGSLLLKAHDEAKNSTGLDLAVYGQEMDNATAGLAKMNTILHDCPTSEIWKDNTLAAPYFRDADGKLKKFDFAIANPPFSFKSWSNGLSPANDLFDRFIYGIPPAKNGDYAFLLHILTSLKSNGKGAVILPHGVLFRGNAEADIRKRILQQGYIKGIIGLPPNLFYGTGIPACIIVIDKADAATRKGIFMVDASKGFMKDGNKNRLRDQVDTFTRQLEVPKYSRMVSLEEIEKNDYNLNIPRYIDSSEPEDLQDITAHLLGGIPDRDIAALENYWQVFPTLKTSLFLASSRQGYSNLVVSPNETKSTVFGHPEFTQFNQTVTALFDRWKQSHLDDLLNIELESKPKTLIAKLSESLLLTFEDAALIDAYDVYQHLMDYWGAVMQDDVYAIAADGWLAAAKPREIIDDKDRKTKEKPDFLIGKRKYKAELIPVDLMIKRFFAQEQAAIAQLENEAAAIAQSIEELKEEHSGEDGLLSEVLEEGKISKGSVSVRLKSIKGDRDAVDERQVLTEYLALLDKEAEANKQIKEAQKQLLETVTAKYGVLTLSEIQSLVVDDKWLAHLAAAVQSEMDRVSQALAGRIKTLGDRYGVTLPQLVDEVAELSAKVDQHLQRMGAVWTI